MGTEMGALSAAELAGLAGVTQAEVERLVGLGILVARDGAGPFLAADAQKVRLATACEQAGLPMDGIASAIRAGRLSFTLPGGRAVPALVVASDLLGRALGFMPVGMAPSGRGGRSGAARSAGRPPAAAAGAPPGLP